MDRPWYRKLFSFSGREAGRRRDLTDVRTQADLGDAEAQFSMGLRCANGVGEELDYAQAVEWYLKAAQQEHPLAQFNLGVMFEKGQGVAKDEVASMAWFDKAANQGDAGAQFRLGQKQHRASMMGTPGEIAEARILAYKWLQLALDQGYKNRDKSLSTIILHMSREDVADGMRRVNDFKAGLAKEPENLPPQVPQGI